MIIPTTRTRVVDRARFGDLIAAEWVKLRSLRSTFWVLGLGMVMAIGSPLLYSRHVDLTALGRASFDPLTHAYGQDVWGMLGIGTGTIGALTVAGEYASGLIRTTFTAVPARRWLVTAKAVVLLALLLPVGAATSVASFAVNHAALAGQHLAMSAGDPGASRAIVAAALFPAACAVIGMGLAALIRHVAATVVALAGLLFLLSGVCTAAGGWLAALPGALPSYAWDRLVVLRAGELGHGPAIGVPQAWVVFGAWPVAAVVLAVVVIQRRDT